MDEQSIRALIDAVDRVLWEVWDPMGVNDCPEARDEYSSYAPVVARMLRDGAADAEIERHLLWIMVERMGLSYVDPHKAARTRAALRALVDGDTPGVRPAGPLNDSPRYARLEAPLPLASVARRPRRSPLHPVPRSHPLHPS